MKINIMGGEGGSVGKRPLSCSLNQRRVTPGINATLLCYNEHISSKEHNDETV